MTDASDQPAEEPVSPKKTARPAAKKTPRAPKAEALTPEADTGEAPRAKPVKEKAPAKPRAKKAAAEPAGELLFSSDRDDTPAPAPKPERAAPVVTEAPALRAESAPPFERTARRPEPAPAAEPPEVAIERPAPTPLPAPEVKVFEAEAKPASGNRHEAVEFDPGAILARFAPKPVPASEKPAETSAPTEAPASPATNERTELRAEFEGPAGESTGEPAPEGERRDERPRHPNDRQNGNRQQQQGGNRHPNDRQQQQGGKHGGQQQQNHRQQHQHGGQPFAQPGGNRHPNDRHPNDRHPNDRQQHQQQGGKHGAKFLPRKQWPGIADADSMEERSLELGEAFNYNSLNDKAVLDEQLALLDAAEGEPLRFNDLYAATVNQIVEFARELGLKLHRTPQRRELVGLILAEAGRLKRPIHITGTLELLEDGNGLIVYGFDNYRVRELSAFIPKSLIRQHALLRGHEVETVALPARDGETAPMAIRVLSVMGADPVEVMRRTPFTELTPYYPTRRLMLETDNAAGWDNLSMRCVDLLCPVGLGQRGLIVAPPRTGKTVLMQAIANSISRNNPDVHLIVLLVDERPEEVTDFRRNSKADEVVSSTFDENAESHVHAAEMVIERARRMVEAGRHVVILLDSITRLARAYNTMVPSSGKILSGGIEAGALTRPKRFFGSARNIEGGGSLTILGTALVDTGSKMDEVIFEEFKGTGNMELDLDRDLANKRIFPAINFERSGTRKEELIYHPEEMAKVHALRRAMKGVPSVEAMEMLITRVKKTKTNAEFLVTLSR